MYLKVLLFCCKGFEMMEFSSFYDVCGWRKVNMDLICLCSCIADWKSWGPGRQKCYYLSFE